MSVIYSSERGTSMYSGKLIVIVLTMIDRKRFYVGHFISVFIRWFIFYYYWKIIEIFTADFYDPGRVNYSRLYASIPVRGYLLHSLVVYSILFFLTYTRTHNVMILYYNSCNTRSNDFKHIIYKINALKYDLMENG